MVKNILLVTGRGGQGGLTLDFDLETFGTWISELRLRLGLDNKREKPDMSSSLGQLGPGHRFD